MSIAHSTITFQETPTLDDAFAVIADLEHRLRRALLDAYHDPIWGVLTRQGIDRRMQDLGDEWVAIVADVDDMHTANELYTHEGVDIRMRVGLRSTDAICGRYQRGDELVFFVPAHDAVGAAERARDSLRVQGMSATFAVVWEASHIAITAGQAAIDAEKKAGRRGHIMRVEGGRS